MLFSNKGTRRVFLIFSISKYRKSILEMVKIELNKIFLLNIIENNLF
jgi:hypothetical protein